MRADRSLQQCLGGSCVSFRRNVSLEMCLSRRLERTILAMMQYFLFDCMVEGCTLHMTIGCDCLGAGSDQDWLNAVRKAAFLGSIPESSVRRCALKLTIAWQLSFSLQMPYIVALDAICGSWDIGMFLACNDLPSLSVSCFPGLLWSSERPHDSIPSFDDRNGPPASLLYRFRYSSRLKSK
jgi:hypothetical protein